MDNKIYDLLLEMLKEQKEFREEMKLNFIEVRMQVNEIKGDVFTLKRS